MPVERRVWTRRASASLLSRADPTSLSTGAGWSDSAGGEIGVEVVVGMEMSGKVVALLISSARVL